MEKVFLSSSAQYRSYVKKATETVMLSVEPLFNASSTKYFATNSFSAILSRTKSTASWSLKTSHKPSHASLLFGARHPYERERNQRMDESSRNNDEQSMKVAENVIFSHIIAHESNSHNKRYVFLIVYGYTLF